MTAVVRLGNGWTERGHELRHRGQRASSSLWEAYQEIGDVTTRDWYIPLDGSGLVAEARALIGDDVDKAMRAFVVDARNLAKRARAIAMLAHTIETQDAR